MCNNDFKNYFKFPLVFKEEFPYVLTNDGKMALTWCIDLPKEKAEEAINKINGYSDKHFDKEWSIKNNIFIYYVVFICKEYSRKSKSFHSVL